MEKLLEWFLSPLVFGIGFLAPLIAQSLVALQVQTPVTPLVIGLVLGGLWGLMAQLRGSWLWIKE